MREGVSDWYDNNISFWTDYTKRTIVGIVAVMSKMLPSRVQPFISGWVTRANQYATGTGLDAAAGVEEITETSSDIVSLDDN